MEHEEKEGATLKALRRCSRMTGHEHRRPARSWDETRTREVIVSPRPHEGVRRALIGSFGAAPTMPQEWTRLLERLH